MSDEFRFMPSAIALAERLATMEEVEARVRQEIAELELAKPEDLIFHSVWWGGSPFPSFCVGATEEDGRWIFVVHGEDELLEQRT